MLTDLADEAENLHIKLDLARDADERAAAAKVLDAIGVKVGKAAANLDQALAGVGAAFDELVAAMPETLAVVQMDVALSPMIGTSHLPTGLFYVDQTYVAATPVDLMRAVLAEGLARVCPTAFGLTGTYGDYRISLDRAENLGGDRPCFGIRDLEAAATASTAADAAAALIVERLRRRAAAILAGEAAPELADRRIYPVSEPDPPLPPYVEVFALKDFRFRLKARNATEIITKRWVHNIPEDVADAAVAAGVALRTDTPEGAAAFQAEKDRRKTSPASSFSQVTTAADCIDLGLIREAAADLDEAA